MNFEQFTEEVREAYPSAEVICATQQPLSVVVDGQSRDIGGLMAAHRPCWLRVDRPEIAADGIDAALVSVEYPSQANLDVMLQISQGTTLVEELLPLDSVGKGALDIVSSTPGGILIQVKGRPVRAVVTVKEVGRG